MKSNLIVLKLSEILKYTRNLEITRNLKINFELMRIFAHHKYRLATVREQHDATTSSTANKVLKLDGHS